MQDRVVSALSWVPSDSFQFPLVLFLIAAPIVYMLAAPGGLLSDKFVGRAPVAQGAAEGDEGESAFVDPSDYRGSDEARAMRPVFENMSAEIEKAARAYPARVAVIVKDLSRGFTYSYHGDDLFPSASLIKVPIMVGVFEKIHNGRLSLHSKLKLRRSTRMGGSGSIKWRSDGTRFTVRQLLEQMMQRSDNTAMLLLIDEIGMGFLQNFFPTMGLVYTEIYPEGLRLTSGRVRYENYTTAREMAMLFEKAYRGELVNNFASELMLDIMKGKKGKTRLAKKLPVGWEIAHKTGLLRRSCHDVGVVYSPNGDYVIAVLTGRNASYARAKDFITRVGEITYKHYRSDFGLVARAASPEKKKD
jgi:beta-lactamase class A